MSKELLLSVKRSQFRSDDLHSEMADKEFQPLRTRVLKDGRNSCVYCGFTASKFQEIHHLDDDHHNNELSNLVIACPLCHVCNHIGFAGTQSVGKLAYLPDGVDISQQDINTMFRYFMMIKLEDSINKKVDSLISLDSVFNGCIENCQLVMGTHSPLALAQVLMGLDDDEYENRGHFLSRIRLIPNYDAFPRQTAFYLEQVKQAKDSAINLAKNKTLEWLHSSGEFLGKGRFDLENYTDIENHKKYEALAEFFQRFKKLV